MPQAACVPSTLVHSGAFLVTPPLKLPWQYVALQLAQTAKAQVPNHPDINDTLGWIYALKGLPSLALPPLTACNQMNPSNATYAYHLGVAYSKVGDKPRARAALERAIKFGGESSDAREAKTLLASIG